MLIRNNSVLYLVASGGMVGGGVTQVHHLENAVCIISFHAIKESLATHGHAVVTMAKKKLFLFFGTIQ